MGGGTAATLFPPLDLASAQAKLGVRKVQHEENDHLNLTAYPRGPQEYFLHGDPSEWGRTEADSATTAAVDIIQTIFDV